jgi:type II secretory ATPase GspE/PulE/Tfp pilus assembly ATPase PilB-like protein
MGIILNSLGDVTLAWPAVMTLAKAELAVSIIKPVAFLVPLGMWGWFVSTVLDKHAERFHLGRWNWNLFHLAMGLGAVIAAMAFPFPSHLAFVLGLAAMVLILAVDIAVYVNVANRDERVPEAHRIRFNLESWKQAREEKAQAKKQGKAELTIKRPDKSILPVPDADSEPFAYRIAAEALYAQGTAARASQVDIAPAGKENLYSVSYLVDGVRQNGEPMPAPNALKVIDVWKAAANLDLADRRRQLIGECQVLAAGSTAPRQLRIMTSGIQGGVRLSMIFDPQLAVRRSADALGFTDSQMAELKAMVEEGQGVVLLGTPPDGGRTTSMYSLLKMHDAYTSNVQTVETDMVDTLEGVRQNKFDATGEGPEYATLVRSILRRDPDVVGVAELPDENTAKEICRADQERTRTYVALRAENAMQAIQIFTKAVGEGELTASALRGVIVQKLLRRLCVNCRVPYQPSAEMVQKLGLPAGQVKQLFKKGGQVLIRNKPEVCPVCGGSGYVGQTGIFEIYRLTPEDRRLIKAGDWAGLKASLRKKQLPSIQQAALIKAREGTTSVEEVSRVTSGGDGSSPAGGGGGQPGKPNPGPKPGAPAGASA